MSNFKTKLENVISLDKDADLYIAKELYLEFYLDNTELGYTGTEHWVIKETRSDFITFIATEYGLGGKDVTTNGNRKYRNYKLNADRYNIDNFEIYSNHITSLLSKSYINSIESEDKEFWLAVTNKCLELNHLLCSYINECLNK